MPIKTAGTDSLKGADLKSRSVPQKSAAKTAFPHAVRYWKSLKNVELKCAQKQSS